MPTGGPFVKLKSSILDSSVWEADVETRIVWITMLAMADSGGVVRASVGGLARRARVSRDACAAALAVLAAPDPDDTSGAEDGRRIREVPGEGWFLVNHARHREFRTPEQIATAERVRRHREKRRVTVTDVTGGNAQKRAKRSEAEAEAEAEADSEAEVAAAAATAAPPSGNQPGDGWQPQPSTDGLGRWGLVWANAYRDRWVVLPTDRPEADRILARARASYQGTDTEFEAGIRAFVADPTRTRARTWAKYVAQDIDRYRPGADPDAPPAPCPRCGAALLPSGTCTWSAAAVGPDAARCPPAAAKEARP